MSSRHRSKRRKKCAVILIASAIAVAVVIFIICVVLLLLPPSLATHIELVIAFLSLVATLLSIAIERLRKTSEN
jgi:hypothetical protein